MGDVRDVKSEVREFLSSRRARITPERAGLPVYGHHRRVAGLRREEVAMLSGVSVDYYVRLERGNLAGVSEQVLDALASTLQLDEAEREYLFGLAKAAGPGRARASANAKSVPTTASDSVLRLLEAVTGAPAWVRNGRHDIVATNPLGRALYSPVLESAVAAGNTARFTFLDPTAARFWRDHEQIAHDTAASLRLEASRNPQDVDIVRLVGELCTRSASFSQHWASRDVKAHRGGLKRLRHPLVGDLDLTYESMPLSSQPGLILNVYTAPVGSPSDDALRLLASLVATEGSARG